MRRRFGGFGRERGADEFGASWTRGGGHVKAAADP